MARAIVFPQTTLKAPRKAFIKEKDGNITVLSRLTFDAAGVDDETLMLLTQYADSALPIKVTIGLGV